MTKPMVRIHNIETNQIIDREMTDDEFAAFTAQQQLDAEQAQLELEAVAAKESAKAKLEALGLTTDDLKALGL
jgi:hypothetical protein